MIIYKITNKVNNKIYIGQTVLSLNKRRNQHLVCEKETPLYNAIRKHGKDNFTFEVICTALNKSYLNELEAFFIKFYDCMTPEGYNLTSGGDSAFSRSEHTKKLQRKAMTGRVVSQETRDKISKSLMGNISPRKGVTLSSETKNKISMAQIGRKVSEETKQKMRDTHKRRLAIDSTRTPAQLEHLRKLHESLRGRKPWNKGVKNEKV